MPRLRSRTSWRPSCWSAGVVGGTVRAGNGYCCRAREYDARQRRWPAPPLSLRGSQLSILVHGLAPARRRARPSWAPSRQPTRLPPRRWPPPRPIATTGSRQVAGLGCELVLPCRHVCNACAAKALRDVDCWKNGLLCCLFAALLTCCAAPSSCRAGRRPRRRRPPPCRTPTRRSLS